MSEGGPSAPRGRGAALLAILQKQKEAAQAVGVQATTQDANEPPKPRGRAELLLKKLKSRNVGAGGDAAVAKAFAAPAEVAVTPLAVHPADPVEDLAKSVSKIEISEPSKPKDAVFYRGESGKPLRLSANFIRLDVEKGRGVFEYEVKFNPDLDAKSQRIRLINQIMREMDSVKVFDGGHLLYLPSKITDTQKSFSCALPDSEEQINIVIIFKKQKSLGDRECIHLYNVLFKRIMHVLLYTQMGRNYFDTEHKHLIPQHKLEVYPGFAVTVEELEGGLMLCLDTQHRVLRNQNAYELLAELRMSTNPKTFKEMALKNLLGSCIFTRYNNKTYIVDDILWDMTPEDKFPTRDGRHITFIEYYKHQYNITIKDPNQPLLLNRKSLKVSGSAQKEDRMVCLVPELSYLTGLTDTMRNDFKVMKDVAVYTRVTPQQRILALRTYLDNVRNNAKAHQILTDWGLTISRENLDLKGRQLNMEEIIFGNQVTKMAGHGADWNRDLANNQVTGPVDLRNWIIFYTEQDNRYARDFSQHMLRLASSLGCIITNPRMEKLPNDLTSTYANCFKNISSSVQAVVFICPSMRTDRYSIIKKMCATQVPVACQVINSRTLSKPDKVRSIILKIALQINCKLGGSLWTVKFPFQGWMICGIDVYHGSPTSSVCGFVSSLNESISRWYSTAIFQTKELGDFYKRAFTKSLEQYKNECASYPSKVIIIRDGVSDGQLEYTKSYEVEQFENILQTFGLNTTLCFIVVQKRISTRLFSMGQGGHYENPPPGTIMDHSITRRYMYDFFLVPQCVRQGTVNPTHYVVLHDKCKLKPDHVQRLCYKLCHLYYNWPGTIRVPAPCQYAHKLAAMVGQYVKGQPLPELADKLWYL